MCKGRGGRTTHSTETTVNPLKTMFWIIVAAWAVGFATTVDEACAGGCSYLPCYTSADCSGCACLGGLCE